MTRDYVAHTWTLWEKIYIYIFFFFDVTKNCEVSLIEITGMPPKEHKKKGGRLDL